jgi:ubiquinone/menaquinone biosynthesis C-methylase UbiE
MNQRSNSDITQKRYDRRAFLYDFLEAPIERFRFGSWRSRLFSWIEGKRILEVGIGTGKNLPYYPKGVKLTAIDLSSRMLEQAQRKVADLNIEVSFLQMDVQQLAFSDRRFDTVLGTFVFCSVPDPVAGLKEVRRVCKPGGRLLLLEHMRPGNALLGLMFDLLNPLVVRMMGANINRRTMENIRKAGWKTLVDERMSSDIVRLIEAEP